MVLISSGKSDCWHVSRGGIGPRFRGLEIGLVIACLFYSKGYDVEE